MTGPRRVRITLEVETDASLSVLRTETFVNFEVFNVGKQAFDQPAILKITAEPIEPWDEPSEEFWWQGLR